MRAITALVEQLRGEKAPRPYDMKYDGNSGKGKIGVRRPDPSPGGEGAFAFDDGPASSGERAGGTPPDDGPASGSDGESEVES